MPTRLAPFCGGLEYPSAKVCPLLPFSAEIMMSREGMAPRQTDATLGTPLLNKRPQKTCCFPHKVCTHTTSNDGCCHAMGLLSVVSLIGSTRTDFHTLIVTIHALFLVVGVVWWCDVPTDTNPHSHTRYTHQHSSNLSSPPKVHLSRVHLLS